MLRRFRIPIRFKILVTQLFAVTVVLGLITYTMAKVFHTDKTAYIHDLISVMAVHTAEEADSHLMGYRESLQVFYQIMVDDELTPQHKEEILKKLFEDFREFVMVTLYVDKEEKGSIYDAITLKSTGVSRQDLVTFRRQNPLPMDRIIEGKIFVENSTVAESLPTITIAMPMPSFNGGKNAVAAGVIRLDKLLRLARSSQVFDTYLVDNQGVLLVHDDPRNVALRNKVDWLSSLQGVAGGQSLGGSMEYSNNGVLMVGGFAPVAIGDLLVGVQIPKKAAYLTARELLKTLVGVSLILLLSSALLSLFWSRRITRPIEQLSDATKMVARGIFDIHVEPSSKDEIGELSESFNRMATELQDAQAALIHSEKMAAFGQLGAGIAHEVKNPLFGILGLAQISLRKAEKDTLVHKNLALIEKECRRCKEIIENLLKFARQEKVAFDALDINTVVEDAAAIVHHQLGTHQVKLKKELGHDLPEITGNANQVQQVLLNLVINAQQAMKGQPGQVTLSTRCIDADLVEIRVSDDGPGIPKDIQKKIFDPFFTTKSAGSGTGLGLSVTYGIIKDHQGEVTVESDTGQGTTFIIKFPVKKAVEDNSLKAQQHAIAQEN